MQTVYFNNTAFHVKNGASAPANRWSLAVYIARSLDKAERYDAAKDNAARMVAQLLNLYEIPLTNVRMHNNWDGSNCPARILQEGTWASFIKAVGKYQPEYAAGNLKMDLTLE